MASFRASSLTVRNIELGLKHKVWGLSPRWRGFAGRIREGDMVILYAIENRSFIVACEVTKECFLDQERIWPDDVYPYRIGIEPLPVSQKPVSLRAARAFSGNPKLGGAFMPAITRLTGEDSEIILSMMTEG